MARPSDKHLRILYQMIRASKNHCRCQCANSRQSQAPKQSQRQYSSCTPSLLQKTRTHLRIMMEEDIHADLTAMRKPYHDKTNIFTEDDLVSLEPYANFQEWFTLACKTESIVEPNAMSLATATKSGVPSIRIVLMKGFSKQGITFFSNYESHKGRDIAENPNVCVNFYWTCNVDQKTNWSRQVRIEGRAERLPESDSAKYFSQRPRSSQIGACVSRQSTPISGRQVLIDREKELETLYSDESKAVPKPDYWGGYLIVPHLFEFWQGQTSRIHDRIIFRKPREGEVVDQTVTKKGEDGWVYERLSP